MVLYILYICASFYYMVLFFDITHSPSLCAHLKVNERDDDGRTALMAAAFAGDLGLMEVRTPIPIMRQDLSHSQSHSQA